MLGLGFLKIIVILLIFAGLVVLQVFLSKKESKGPGLILPIIFLGLSAFGVLNLVVVGYQPAWQIALTVLGTLFYFNIPTLILLAVYFAVRIGRKKSKDIEKMNIQDLD